jgi:hypothetical protein
MASSPSNQGSPLSVSHSTEQSVESQNVTVGVSLWGRLVRAFMSAAAITEMHLGKSWQVEGVHS